MILLHWACVIWRAVYRAEYRDGLLILWRFRKHNVTVTAFPEIIFIDPGDGDIQEIAKRLGRAVIDSYGCIQVTRYV
jgi:hypothetical protein